MQADWLVFDDGELRTALILKTTSFRHAGPSWAEYKLPSLMILSPAFLSSWKRSTVFFFYFTLTSPLSSTVSLCFTNEFSGCNTLTWHHPARRESGSESLSFFFFLNPRVTLLVAECQREDGAWGRESGVGEAGIETRRWRNVQGQRDNEHSTGGTITKTTGGRSSPTPRRTEEDTHCTYDLLSLI